MNLRWAWFAVAFVSACGPDRGEGTDTDDPGGTSSGSTTEALPAGCECAAPECTQELCAPAVYSEDEGNCDTIDTTEEPLRCVLEALRDRTPGTVRWTDDTNCNQERREVELTIFADGTAWQSESGHEFGYGSAGPIVVGALRPAEDFAACLASPEPEQWESCLRNTLQPEWTVCKHEESLGSGV